MSTHSTVVSRLATPSRRLHRSADGSVRAPLVRGRRAADRRPVSARRAPGNTQTSWVAEAIARFIDENPSQLYRGGA